MKNKLLIGIALLSILFVSGCQEQTEELIETEQSIECMNDMDCNTLASLDDFKYCIDNKCISYLRDCEDIATQDYNMKNPFCRSYSNKCYCKDYVIESPEKRIVKNNSIQIISAKAHFENDVVFELKKYKRGYYIDKTERCSEPITDENIKEWFGDIKNYTFEKKIMTEGLLGCLIIVSWEVI